MRRFQKYNTVGQIEILQIFSLSRKQKELCKGKKWRKRRIEIRGKKIFVKKNICQKSKNICQKAKIFVKKAKRAVKGRKFKKTDDRDQRKKYLTTLKSSFLFWELRGKEWKCDNRGILKRNILEFTEWAKWLITRWMGNRKTVYGNSCCQKLS